LGSRNTLLTGDVGIDFKASRVMEAGNEVVLCIQCKNYQSPARVKVVRQLNGVVA